MARGVNKVILVGNLGQDPELNHTGSGTAVCNMRLATNESYKDSNGELVERAEWHSIVAWAQLAEICDQYLEKGSQVYVEGSLQTRQWEDRDGNTRYTTEIKMREMMMLDSNRQSRSGGGGNRGGGQRGQQGQGGQRQQPQRQQPQGQPAQQSQGQGAMPGAGDLDPQDNLPF